MLEYPIPWRVALIIVTVGIANSCGMVNEQGAGTYGEFCGVGRPDVSAFTNEDEKVFALNHVAPTDYIDCACREHDICYARRGRNDKACDALLDYIIDERALRNWCSSVSFDIQGYFDYVHPHGTWVGSVLSSALYLPIRAALLPVDLIEYSVARSSGEFGALCQYQPDRIDKWMAGWINLQNRAQVRCRISVKNPKGSLAARTKHFMAVAPQ